MLNLYQIYESLTYDQKQIVCQDFFGPPFLFGGIRQRTSFLFEVIWIQESYKRISAYLKKGKSNIVDEPKATDI